MPIADVEPNLREAETIAFPPASVHHSIVKGSGRLIEVNVVVEETYGMADRPQMILFTAGYRDAQTDKRLSPEAFYGALPPEAVTVDIRSHPYSPFAPAYTGRGVALAVEHWKPGEKTFYHVRELGNTHRDANGKRMSPPIYVDEEAGFARLEAILRAHGSAAIFCACSYATHNSATHRCHRFFVADTISAQLPNLRVLHLEEQVE